MAAQGSTFCRSFLNTSSSAFQKWTISLALSWEARHVPKVPMVHCRHSWRIWGGNMLVTGEQQPYLAGSGEADGRPPLRAITLGKIPGGAQIRCQLRAVRGQ